MDFLLAQLGQVSDVLGANPQETIATQEQTATECRRHLDELLHQVDSQHEAVEDAHVRDNELEARLTHQRDLIVDIMREYQEGLLSVAGQYRLRVDDYVSNQHFESEASTQFQNRYAYIARTPHPPLS